MSERIRYKKLSETIMESVRVFSHPTNGAQYKIRLNMSEPMWYVLDANTEIVAASGRNLNKNKAQLEVRNALRELGVEISTEKRNEYRKKTLPAA
jgi:hypothetical protein